MEASILTSTKQLLGLEPSYTAFDLDVTTHINAAFSHLTDLGVGPEDGFAIEDATAVWGDYGEPTHQLSRIKTFVGLYVRREFDPPQTGPLAGAMDTRINELTWRLNTQREVLADAD